MFKENWPENDEGVNSLILHAFIIAGLLLGCANIAYSAEIEGGSIPSQVSSLRLAPIRLAVDGGGLITYQSQRITNNNSSASSQALNVSAYSGIKAQSFIWQPWFSKVNGGLGVGISKGYSNSSQLSTNKSASLIFSGTASISLIPRSRFPFEATISKSRARQSSGVTSIDSVSKATSLSLAQHFASRNGSLKGALNFYRDNTSDSVFAPNTNDYLSLNFQHFPIVAHRIDVVSSVKRSFYPRYDSRVLMKKFALTYNFRPTSFFSTNSVINLDSSTTRQSNVASTTDAKQFALVGNWGSPSRRINLIANARVYSLGGSIAYSATSPTKGASLYLSTNYTISKEVSAIASVNIQDDNVTGQIITTTALLNSSKNFTDIINTMGFIYKRYIAASISSQNKLISNTNNNTQSNSNTLGLNLSAGHSLTKQNKLLSGVMTSNINQVVATGVTTNNEFTRPVSLATNASIGWLAQQDYSRSQTIGRISANDIRNFGNDNKTGATQLYNILVSRTEALPRFQSLSANINLQQINQTSTLTAPGNRSFSSRAAVNYLNNRPFSIRGMTLSSALSVTQSTQGGAQQQTSNSWNNNVNYILGLLEFNLGATFVKSMSTKSSNILFSAKRKF